MVKKINLSIDLEDLETVYRYADSSRMYKRLPEIDCKGKYPYGFVEIYTGARMILSKNSLAKLVVATDQEIESLLQKHVTAAADRISFGQDNYPENHYA